MKNQEIIWFVSDDEINQTVSNQEIQNLLFEVAKYKIYLETMFVTKLSGEKCLWQNYRAKSVVSL